MDAVSLRRIAALATANQARVTVLDVIEPLPRWHRFADVEGRQVDIQEMLETDRQKRLRAFAAEIGLADVAVAVRTGKPFVEVIRYVLSEHCDLVVVGDEHGHDERASGVSAEVLQLLRKCPVPVWAMRPTRARKLRVLALVDPDPADPVRDGLNDLVLELATSMTAGQNGELHVGHAWDLPGEGMLRSSAYVRVSRAELEMMVQAAAAEHQSRLRELVDRHHVFESGGQVHLVKGEAGRALPELAERLNTNLIVMGTVARTGLSGFVIGNTAETVLRTVDCSVLAVKPAGFVSPVEVDVPSARSS